MIETIYSSENEENDRAGKSQVDYKMPKNIRQVGKSNANKKIYVEDYVMTFIKQLAGGDYSECNIAVLVGQCIKLENCRNIFVSGAIKVNDIATINDFAFTNDTWTSIYEDIKKYFIENEIVGWFIGGPGYLLAEDDKILKTHIDNFAGQDKILLTYDNIEKEETFLSYENNRLCKQDGYYIYYEKNEEMQTYIIDHKKNQSIEMDYDDKVSKEMRTIIQNKKPSEEENKSVIKLMYAAGTLLAVIVLIVGAAMLRNYDQMKSMQDTLNYLSKNMQEVQTIFSETGDTNTEGDTQADGTQADDTQAEGTQEDGTQDASADPTESTEDSLDVEVVPGNVEPLAEDTGDSGNEDAIEDSNDNDNNGDEKPSDKEIAQEEDSSEKPDADTGDNAKQEDSTDSAKNEVKYYTVADGDTLADISYKLYNTYTKVDKIMKLNGIDDQNLIYVGQKLIVP